MSAVEYRPARIRRITELEWANACSADTPPLPWCGPQGQRIFSFILMPVPECGTQMTVAFLDALGKPVLFAECEAMSRTAMTLNPVLGELTFLPDALQ